MKKIFAFLSKLFNKAKYWINKVVVPSIVVVESLKLFVDSAALPVLTALIPGHLDDVIATQVKKYLPIVLQTLQISVDCVNREDPQSVLQCAVDALKKLNPEGRAAAYHNIASLLVTYLSDKHLSWSEAIHLTEMTYQQLKKK